MSYPFRNYDLSRKSVGHYDHAVPCCGQQRAVLGGPAHLRHLALATRADFQLGARTEPFGRQAGLFQVPIAA